MFFKTHKTYSQTVITHTLHSSSFGTLEQQISVKTKLMLARKTFHTKFKWTPTVFFPEMKKTPHSLCSEIIQIIIWWYFKQFNSIQSMLYKRLKVQRREAYSFCRGRIILSPHPRLSQSVLVSTCVVRLQMLLDCVFFSPPIWSRKH